MAVRLSLVDGIGRKHEHFYRRIDRRIRYKLIGRKVSTCRLDVDISSAKDIDTIKTLLGYIELSMKNECIKKPNNPFMKLLRLLLGMLITLCLLTSCDSTPVIDGSTPFIVTKIEYTGNGMCEYFGTNEARYDGNGFSGRPSLVLPAKAYNIGDTIHIVKKLK